MLVVVLVPHRRHAEVPPLRRPAVRGGVLDVDRVRAVGYLPVGQDGPEPVELVPVHAEEPVGPGEHPLHPLQGEEVVPDYVEAVVEARDDLGVRRRHAYDGDVLGLRGRDVGEVDVVAAQVFVDLEDVPVHRRAPVQEPADFPAVGARMLGELRGNYEGTFHSNSSNDGGIDESRPLIMGSYSTSFSIPIPLRFSSRQARRVVPDPRNGSSTRPPGGVTSRTR